jgi:hypothetical protein
MRAYDIIIVGANSAGLWLGTRLLREGYNLIVTDHVEAGRDAYFAQNLGSSERWEACLGGWGDVDLSGVASREITQYFWPENESVPGISVAAAARGESGHAAKIKPADFPPALARLKKDKNAKNKIYSAPARAADAEALVAALSEPLKGRLLRGRVQELLPDGQIAISGLPLRAQLVVFMGGAPAARAFSMMRIKEKHAEARAQRHVFVQALPYPFHARVIGDDLSARIDITSRAAGDEGHMWHIRAPRAPGEKKRETLERLRAEMARLLPETPWEHLKWAARDVTETILHAKPGVAMHQRGRVLICRDGSASEAPFACDRVLNWMRGKDVSPQAGAKPPPLPALGTAQAPWERAAWKNLP